MPAGHVTDTLTLTRHAIRTGLGGMHKQEDHIMLSTAAHESMRIYEAMKPTLSLMLNLEQQTRRAWHRSFTFPIVTTNFFDNVDTT